MHILKNFALVTAGLMLMPTLAAAQQIADNGKGEISLGASYSSQHGAVAVVGFDGTNVGGSGIDAALNYRRGETGEGGSARLRYSRDLATDRLGQNAQIFALGQAASSNWQGESYQSQSQDISVGVSADLGQKLGYSTSIFFRNDKISGLGAGTSPLVTAALGKSTAAGVEFVAHFGKLTGGVLPQSGAQLDTGLAWAGAGDRKTSAIFAAGTIAQPMGAANTAVLRAEAGRIQGLNGQSVGIQDRAFLGASGGPRGFAFGSIGPRDFVAGTVNTPLGGNRYMSVSAELRRDVTDRLSIGVFTDAGAVWDLGGAAVTGASGVIDAGKYIRSSGGVAVYWDTALGKLNISLAKPINSQANDTFNEASISLMRSF